MNDPSSSPNGLFPSAAPTNFLSRWLVLSISGRASFRILSSNFRKSSRLLLVGSSLRTTSRWDVLRGGVERGALEPRDKLSNWYDTRSSGFGSIRGASVKDLEDGTDACGAVSAGCKTRFLNDCWCKDCCGCTFCWNVMEFDFDRVPVPAAMSSTNGLTRPKSTAQTLTKFPSLVPTIIFPSSGSNLTSMTSPQWVGTWSSSVGGS